MLASDTLVTGDDRATARVLVVARRDAQHVLVWTRLPGAADAESVLARRGAARVDLEDHTALALEARTEDSRGSLGSARGRPL